MPEFIKESRPILKTILILGFISGIIIGLFGIWLVILKSVGESQISLLGATIKTTSVGIAAIFLGVCVIIFSIRKTTDSLKYVSEFEAAPTNDWPDHRIEKTFIVYLRGLTDDKRSIIKKVLLLKKKKFNGQDLGASNDDEKMFWILMGLAHDGIIVMKKEHYQIYPDVLEIIKNSSSARAILSA